MNAVFSAVKVCASNEAILPRCCSTSDGNSVNALASGMTCTPRDKAAPPDSDALYRPLTNTSVCHEESKANGASCAAVTAPVGLISGENLPSAIGATDVKCQSSLRDVGNPR